MQAMTSVRNFVALSLAAHAQMHTGNQLLQNIAKLRQDLANWLSPPDPSINLNTFGQARHEGTAEWFTQSSVFRNWKASSSFMWIHGKRTSSALMYSPLLTDLHVHSWFRKICSQVSHLLILSGLDSWLILSTFDQLCGHPGHQERS